MRTRLRVSSNGTLISEKVILAKPIQETTEVQNVLLSGEWHVQTIGDPRRSYDLEFLVPATKQQQIDSYAALKTVLLLERHGKAYTGVISGNPEWDQVRGSGTPENAVYRCKILLLVTGGG
jgi:hypothetical protein